MKNTNWFSDSFWKNSLLCSAILFASASCFAQQKFVRAQGVDSSKQGAVQAAKQAAWKNYLGTLQGAKLDNIIANEKLLLENLDTIITDVNVIDEQCPSGLFSKCTVNIKVTVNESIIESRLRQTSQLTRGGKMSNAEDVIALLVMARVADVQTGFDEKITKRVESTVGTTGASAMADAATGNRTETAEASAGVVAVTQVSKTVVGGSQQTKRDHIVYFPWPNIDDFQNSLSETLNNNRINASSWEDLVNNCDVSDAAPFSKLYADSENGQLPAAIRTDLFKKFRNCQINKFIMASVEVDGYRIDPNTGLWMASGNINVIVYDLAGRFSKSIGSANRTFSGRAEKKTDASRAALANATKLAADVIVNQLNLK